MRDNNLRTHDINFSTSVAITRKESDPDSLRTVDICPPKPTYYNRSIHVVPDNTTQEPFLLNSDNLDVSDISRVPDSCTAQRLRMREMTRSSGSLRTDDIVGAKAKQPLRPRDTNPLDPKYQLPSYEEEPPLPHRFTRPSLIIDDIEGTRTVDPRLRIQTRDAISVSDIEGTYPKALTKARQGVHFDPLETGDICSAAFRTQRIVDPQNPQYVVSRVSNSFLAASDDWDAKDARAHGGESVMRVGHIDGTKPKPVRKPKPKDLQFSLRTDDVLAPSNPKPERKQLIIMNYNGDIDGSQPGKAFPLLFLCVYVFTKCVLLCNACVCYWVAVYGEF